MNSLSCPAKDGSGPNNSKDIRSTAKILPMVKNTSCLKLSLEKHLVCSTKNELPVYDVINSELILHACI